ncbi:Developmental pluripotency-associated protein 4 [Varanus komodoensis]|nr:Developmental pluripotency-associated protein 4 [Varanus komodoensis]
MSSEIHLSLIQAPPTVSDQGVTKDIKTEPSEEKTDLVQGWCVVHGMVLYRPRSSWASLQLRGGLVCVQDGKDVVPFHLPPLNLSVPKGFADNYVCLDCVLRNREKPKQCLTCQQVQGKGSRASLAKNVFKSFIPLQNGASQTSLLPSGTAKSKRRTTEIRKLYQPQEDQAYAQRVDGILSQMARGELGMDRALCPLQPLVFHSPAPFDRCGM